MAGTHENGSARALAFAALSACLLIASASIFPVFDLCAAGDRDDAAAKKAFAEATQVLFHPRCMNCHPQGDGPTIRDDSRPHSFGVRRGPDGRGENVMNCSLCHQDKNRPDGPPGAPNWHMPPAGMPMAFQGRTPGQLCRQLKDPGQNGGRTGEKIVEHIDRDPLVKWAWDPGKGRISPKMRYEEFSARMHEWLDKGCACPE